MAKRYGRALATRFPSAVFRSGNAEGSDQAFSEGVVAVDASRLYVVAPNAGHRRKHRHPDATYEDPTSLTRVREEPTLRATIAATPRNKDIFAAGAPPRVAAKASYLIRDTMKAMGYSETDPVRPSPVFVWTWPAGGPGHTIRVCQQACVPVPVLFQGVWSDWIGELDSVCNTRKICSCQFKEFSLNCI